MAIASSTPSKLTTREKILLSAQKLFLEQGFDGTSMSDIAKNAAVNQSLIHHHFANKETLWGVVRDSLFDEYLTTFEEHLESGNRSSNFFTYIEMLLRYRFNFLKENPDVARVLQWQSVNPGNKSVFAGERSNDRIKELMQEALADISAAQSAKQIRDDFDPAMLLITSAILTSGWFHGNIQWLVDCMGDENNAQELEEKYLKFVVQLITKSLKDDA